MTVEAQSTLIEACHQQQQKMVFRLVVEVTQLEHQQSTVTESLLSSQHVILTQILTQVWRELTQSHTNPKLHGPPDLNTLI